MNKNLIKKLFETPGVSGREEKVAEIIKAEIKKNGLELERDNLGGVWGIKKSKKKDAKTILIDSHMDEVGFLVTNISSNGLIQFVNQGGIWNQIMNSQRLRVWTSDYKKSFSGVVLFPNVNTHKGTGATPEISDMFLDIGATSKEEVLKWGIQEGDAITFDTLTEINGNRVIAKAADNRVGVGIVIELMKFIKDKEFDFNIILGASTQEEVGLRGTRVSTYKFSPDLGFVIDVSPARDIPAPQLPNGILGAGTMLRHKDAATVYLPHAIDYVRKILDTNKVKYQDYFSLGGTNAGMMHLQQEGRTVLPFGIVARNLHTGSLVFDIKDYDDTVKLIELILLDLNSNKIVKLI